MFLTHFPLFWETEEPRLTRVVLEAKFEYG